MADLNSTIVRGKLRVTEDINANGNITTNGTLYLTKATDLSGTANNHPALIVGGTDTTAHLEIDANEIHAKASGTTVGPLYLNHEGGYTCLSGEKTYSDGTYLYSNSTKVSVDGHTHEVSDITDLYKQEYNLGYYDTITANSDGTYTITRQTGYVDIDNETLTYLSDNNRPRWLICNLSNKAVIPSVNTELGQIITGNYETKTEANAWNTNSGMSLNTSGDVVIYGATRPTGIIQYKLATPYTEKVEKNHYAAYNQNFVLEHNKSEAEKSANLFDVNNVEYGSIDENGSNMESGHARVRSFYIPVLPNTYYSISANNPSLLIYELYQYDSNKSYIAPYVDILEDTYTFLTKNNTYYIRILFRNTSNTDFNLDILSRVMLNYGTTPLPYQPYEGKVVHEKDLDNYVTTDTAQSISGYKKISSIGIDTINGATLGNAIMRQNTSTGDVILGSTVRQLRLWGNGDRPTYSKDDGVSYKNLALLSDLDNYVPEENMLAANTNLNTVITSGFYRLQAISTHINGMDISYGQMIVCQGGGDTIAQLVFPYLSSKMLFRTGNPVDNPGGKWNDWKEVSLEGHTHSQYLTSHQNEYGKISDGTNTTTANAVQDTITFSITTGSTAGVKVNGDTVTITQTDTDTKNTAGSSNNENKLFLIGATSQTGSTQTYSNQKVYTQSKGVYANAFYAASDRRLKENIKDLDLNYLDLVNNINLREFSWKADEEHKPVIGAIAQELRQVLPEKYVHEFIGGQETDDEYLSINDSKLVYLLIGAIQEQQKEIESLKAKIGSKIV